jgi:hypothetical protein
MQGKRVPAHERVPRTTPRDGRADRPSGSRIGRRSRSRSHRRTAAAKLALRDDDPRLFHPIGRHAAPGRCLGSSTTGRDFHCLTYRSPCAARIPSRRAGLFSPVDGVPELSVREGFAPCLRAGRARPLFSWPPGDLSPPDPRRVETAFARVPYVSYAWSVTFMLNPA